MDRPDRPPLDAVDAEVLDRLGALHDRLDGPPPGFTDLMVFAVAAHGLEVELARLEEGMRWRRRAGRGGGPLADLRGQQREHPPAGRGRRRGPRAARRLARAGGASGRRGAHPRRGGPTRPSSRTTTDGSSSTGCRHGFVQVVVRRGPDEPVVVTPTFEL